MLAAGTRLPQKSTEVTAGDVVSHLGTQDEVELLRLPCGCADESGGADHEAQHIGLKTNQVVHNPMSPPFSTLLSRSAPGCVVLFHCHQQHRTLV